MARPPLLAQSELRRRVRAARELTAPTADEVAARRRRAAESKRRRRAPDIAASGLTQAELAARIVAREHSIGPDNMSLIERGETRLSRDHIEWIAEACGLPLEYFYFDFAELRDSIPDINAPRADGPALAPPGALGRSATGSQTTPEREPRKANPKAAGKKPAGR